MINVPDPIPELKQQLAREITRLLGRYHQEVAAAILGLEQPRMSELSRGRLDRFSLQRLIRLLANVGRRVELTVIHPADPRIRLLPRFRRRVIVERR